MRILFLTGADQKYGTLHMALSLIQAAKDADWELEYVVVTQKKGLINELCDQMHIENYAIPYRYCVYVPCENRVLDYCKRQLKRMTVYMHMLYAWRSIHRKVDFERIDVIHTNNNRDLFGCALAARHHKPHVVHLREFMVEDFNLTYLFQRQIEYMNEFTDCFVAVSNAVRDGWIQKGLDQAKTRVVYDGIDDASIPHKDKERHDNALRLVMVGYISKEKGQIQLIKAIQLLNDKYPGLIKADFYGDGKRSYVKEMNAYVQKHALGDVIRFMGFKNDVSQRLWQYDVGFNCSKSEGFGLVTLEYMLAGICPIVSDAGANAELVRDGESGLLYKYGDEADLADKIKMLIDNPDVLREMSGNARKRAASHFSLESCVSGIRDVYLDLYGGACREE